MVAVCLKGRRQEVGAEGCPLQGWPEFAHFASLLSIRADRRHNKEKKYKSKDGDDDNVKKHA